MERANMYHRNKYDRNKAIRCGCFVLLCLLAYGWLGIQPANAQVVVFLPEYSQFRVNSSFFVPDGGSLYQGGIGRSAMGASSSGVPGLGNIPGLGRLGRNRGIGYSTGTSGVVTTARVFNMREIGEGLLKGTHDRYGNLIRPPATIDGSTAASSFSSGSPSTGSAWDARKNRPGEYGSWSSEMIERRARFLKANLGRNR